MKTKGLSLIIIGLCMLFSLGTAHAVVGVDDNVPAQELIFPFICEGSVDESNHAVFGTFNTLWSYAETVGQETYLQFSVKDRKGNTQYDGNDHLTSHDVGGNDCQSLISNMYPDAQRQLLTTIDGKDYFAGYLTVSKYLPDDGIQNLIGWVTFYDRDRSSNNTGYTAANFKPYQAEAGADPDTFAEAMGEGPMYADQYYLRYDISNGNNETFNWWILLRGKTYCDLHPTECDSGVVLAGTFCNEEEKCYSSNIPVPDRLNIINVENYVPASFSVYPKKGFAYFALIESGYRVAPGMPATSFTNEDFTAFMWSYQRQQSVLHIPYPVDPKKLNKFDLKYGIIYDNELWSVIDPADRLRRSNY